MKHILAAVLLAVSTPVIADSVTDVRTSGDGIYTMKIDGKQYVAVMLEKWKSTVDAAQQYPVVQERLAIAERDLGQYRSLTATYEKLKNDHVVLTEKYKLLSEDSIKLNERYSETGNKLVTLTKEYGVLVKDYDALVQKYRDVAVRTAPRHPFDLGLGVVHSNDEDHAVAMAGMGTQLFNVELRGWVFGGQDTYGVMVGTSF